MDLLCPHCQKRLNLPDASAGQVVRCPLCAATFTAPGMPLGPEPTPHQPELAPLLPPDLNGPEVETPIISISEELPAKAPSPFTGRSQTGEGYALVHDAPTPSLLSEPSIRNLGPKTGLRAPPAAPTLPGAPASEAAPSGNSVPIAAPIANGASAEAVPPKTAKSEYTYSLTLYLRRDAAAWIAPIGLMLLVILACFPWEIDLRELSSRGGYKVFGTRPPPYLWIWHLAFSQGSTGFLVYIVLLLLALPWSIAALCLQKKWIAPSPILRRLLPWSSLIVAGLTIVPLFLILTSYFNNNFHTVINPSTVWMKLAVRVHFLVVFGAFFHFWLARRVARKVAEPRLVLRW
jgi:hypothetical protein